MSKLIISLTTIPPRFPYLHEVIEGLMQQTADVEAIHLYIPRTYRRFEYAANDLPKLPDAVQVSIVDRDYGPATKVLPAVREYAEQDVMILFGDDDEVYDPEWAARFVRAAQKKPDCAICEEGGLIGEKYNAGDKWRSNRTPKAAFRQKDLGYRLKRAASLGMWRPTTTTASGHVDIFEGWGGVLVRPHFFDERTFDIPDILWTVDDVWLSGCLERLGVPIWLCNHGKIRITDISNPMNEASLSNFVTNGHDRDAANRACVEYMRRNFGIWGGHGALTINNEHLENFDSAQSA